MITSALSLLFLTATRISVPALALALVMTLPLVRYLQISATNKWVRMGLLVSMMLIVVAILGTQSRGGFLGLAACALFLVYKSRHRFSLLLLVLLSIPILYQLMPSSYHERLSTIQTYEEDGSAMGRISMWRFAYELALDRPLLGGGYSSFTVEQVERLTPDLTNFKSNKGGAWGAHSIYFENLGHHGFVGLALYLLLGISAFRAASRLVKNASKHQDLIWARDLAAMVQVSLIGFAVSGTFLELATFDLTYHLFAIIMVLTVIVKNHKEAPQETSQPAEELPLRHNRTFERLG